MHIRSTAIVLGVSIAFLLAAGAVRAGDWPQFRGPNTLGITPEKNLPTEWGGADGKNILWKTPLPKADTPFSSPIVTGGRVFLTTSLDHPVTQGVICFDAADGKLLWKRDVDPGPWRLGDLRAGYGAPTPAADKEHIFAFFGSAVLVALDYNGKILWRRDFQSTAFDVGIGTSPILFDQTIILQLDQNGGKSVLIAIDKVTGKSVWETPRKDNGFSHSTPVIVQVNGKTEMLLSGRKDLAAYDPAMGTRIWSIDNQGETPSPAFGDGLVYVDAGRGDLGTGICADITGETPTLKWTVSKSEEGEGFSSAAILQGLVYKSLHSDTLLCRKGDTGEIVFSEHLKGLSTAVSPIVTADPLLYFVSSGRSYILKPGPKIDIVATNDLDDPNPGASAAIADGKIFIRGTKFLYCIGSK